MPEEARALLRVSFRVPAAEAETARARLLALAPGGFEEVELGTGVELAVYGDAEVEGIMRAAFHDVGVEPVALGWEDAWREFHRPVRAGGLWIGPPWEAAPPGEPAVVVDPGRAFGTGAHATTRACIELLARRERGSVLDAGCGSGVVAVAAARLGFEPVFALDSDPVATAAAAATAAANGVRVHVRLADVTTAELPRVELVVANIELRSVEALLARRPASAVIASGYLAGEAPATPGWTRAERLELDGWAADLHAAS